MSAPAAPTLTVEPLQHADLPAAAGFDGSFIVTSRLRLRMTDDGALAFDTEPVPAYRKLYGDEADADAVRDYLDHPKGDAAAFVARLDGQVIGRVLLSRTWNSYAAIDDISVSSRARRCGAGSALLRQALDWARGRGLAGAMLETQDSNVAACRLYHRHGFVLGGFDRFLYANEPDVAHETALFWYCRF